MKKGRLFVISAPSGCGKTTLCKKLLAGKLGLTQSVSVTTRPPRGDEENGRDYHFVSRKEFRRMVRRREFLEHEENFGYLYGTPKRFIEENLKKGRSILLSIDVKGAMKVKSAYPRNSVLLFLLPPSFSALKRRLLSRMTDRSEAISTRLKIAKREITYKNRYNHTVINDSLNSTYKRLKRIIIQESKKGKR